MTIEIEIISIGNELLIGKIENTNAFWLAKQSTKIGANVTRVTVIQDIVSTIGKTICESIARKPQFVITTGGLGPTFDDKTLQGVASALNASLEVHPQALSMVRDRCEEYFKKRHMTSQIEMTPARAKMATLPQGSEPIRNPIGTAPGVQAKFEGTILFALPGVPAEMKAIYKETIVPLIKIAVGDNLFCETSLFIDGLPESYLAPIIDKVMADNVGVYIKSHPISSKNKAHIETHLTIIAPKENKPMERLRKAAKELGVLVIENGGKAQPE